MKICSLVLAAVAAMSAVSATSTALAQEQQYMPVLSYRTGPYAPNGTPVANGIVDYYKLVNERGGINGVKLLVEECETGYDTARSVECYERMKGQNGGATLILPWSTGATFAMTEKTETDKIPLITIGYGRSESADGNVFKWNFPLIGTYWIGVDVIIQYIGQKEGGLDKLKGKKIALVYHDSPFGKEAIPPLQERARRHGFEVQLLPVTAPGVEQKATWLQVRKNRPDYLLLWGWGAMNSTALKEAQATGYPREKMYGVWWAGSEPAVRDVAAGAKGFNAVALQHGAGKDAPVIKEILEKIHGKGQGTGPKEEVGDVNHLMGVVNAAMAVEGIRAAQEKFGTGKVMTGEQVRWGLENLNLPQDKLDALGFAGVLRGPIKTSCNDHVGTSATRIHTWDGSKWVMQSDWIEADRSILDPMIKDAAAKYAAEKKLPARPAADCAS